MNHHKQRGVVLITSLIILIVLSLLALYMFGGFTQDEKISGNTREKARAVDAAFASLNEAQFWMSTATNIYAGDWVTGVPCSVASATPVVCSNPILNPATAAWGVGTAHTPSGMALSTTGGLGTYAANTKYHIQFIAKVGSNPGVGMYRVTAMASGGNATAVAVQQAVFEVSTDSQDIGGG